MKIALLFTGQLRTYNMTKDFIKKSIIDKYDTDVFLSIDTNNRVQLSQKYNKNDLTEDTINDVIKLVLPIKGSPITRTFTWYSESCISRNNVLECCFNSINYNIYIYIYILLYEL